MNTHLISIIIPTFNRAHLIGETLDSVLAQSYTNWECIVVDDGSEDTTDKIVKCYVENDPRFKYFRRPSNRQKGANACRNYGFENSVGDFIIWFDSDDLMVSNHIALKVDEIIDKNVDFVIAQTANFKGDQLQEPYKYSKPVHGIRAEDFILRKIHWYTYDIMLCRSLAEKISYNEKMKSWQDYNYFCKMLLISAKGHYIDVVLTHRRVHANTIQGEMTRTNINFNRELLEAKVFTYLDIQSEINIDVKKDYLFGLMNICFYLAMEKIMPKYFMLVSNEIKKVMGIKSLCWFLLAIFTGFIFKKGELFLNLSKNKRISFN